MKPGRPSESIVRDRIKAILLEAPSYAYKIYKEYLKKYGPTSRRNIYYHLKKGVDLGEFEIDRIEKKDGDFTWGPVTERIYYKAKAKY